MHQAASHAAMQTNTSDKAEARASLDTTLAKNATPSIGTRERTMLYQPQDTMSAQSQEPNTAKQTPSTVAKADHSDNLSVPAAKADHADKDSASQKKAASKDCSKGSVSRDGQAADKKQNSFQTVTEDYFSDALFIGDSRTVGLLQSHLLPESAYYAKTGIGIGDILSERIVNEGGTMISVAEALHRHSFGKVYIMIGINDISRGDVDWFTEQYQNILDTIRQTQPEAIIYIQANIPMSYGTQDLNGALNNKNLSLRNEASRALADSKTVFYLDIADVYADGNGCLASNYTRDGLHVLTEDYPLWVDYLLHHGIVRE